MIIVNVKTNSPDFIALSLSAYYLYLQESVNSVDEMERMEHRGEPRFPVRSPIRVIVPGEEPRTMDSTLIDISGTGLRFTLAEPVRSEDVLAVEVDSRLVLCEVRHCQPRGDRYVVGVRRLHEIAKDAQLSDAPSVVTEMLGHLRRHIAAGSSDDSQTMAVKQLEQIIERSENPQVERSENPQMVRSESPQPVHSESLQPERSESLQPERSESLQPERSENPQEVALPQVVAPAEPESIAWQPQPEPEPEPEPEPKPEPVKAVQETIVRAPARHSDPLEAAREALSTSAAAPLANQPGNKLTGKRLLIGLAASLILAALLAFFFLDHRTEAKPPEPKLAPAPVQPVSEPAQAPTPSTHHARIHVLLPVWFAVAIDSGPQLNHIGKKDEVEEFDFSKNATIRVGDAASIDLTIDGNPTGPIEAGQKVLQLRPDGVELVK